MDVFPEDVRTFFEPENIDKELGQYLISKHKLGEGGTSVVKLAWHKQKKVTLAVKIIAKYRLTDRGRDNLEREYGYFTSNFYAYFWYLQRSRFVRYTDL